MPTFPAKDVPLVIDDFAPGATQKQLILDATRQIMEAHF
jgi:hypothetical protein